MPRRIPTIATLLLSLLFLQPAALRAADDQPALKLPAIFSDNMVLQRNFATPIWGLATPGQAITVKIADQTKQATAGPDGKWMIKLDPMKEGGPHNLSISGPSTITYGNVLIGDVWICSGQSNMQWSIKQSKDPQSVIENSTNPALRLFHVQRIPAATPQFNCKGAWTESNPTTTPEFSAVAWHFGQHLQKELNVPIGLIHTSWGGTAIQLWQSKEAIEADADMKQVLDDWQKRLDQYEADKKKYQAALAEFKAQEKPKTIEVDGKPITLAKAPQPPRPLGNGPATLYNGMIAPLIPYGITGAIWYQGESNAGNPELYRKQMPAMINQWRKEFGHQFPFYQVQLANFFARTPEPSDSGWPRLREAQLLTAQTTPRTGLAVIIDIGEEKDIHPKNKQDVGQRLALAALGTTYNKPITYSGPIYDTMKIEANKIRLTFKHTGGGLEAKSDDRVAGAAKVKGFSIAGEDKKFVWADAQIDGNTIIVSSPEVANPVAVRYAWANNPDCNLYNKEGLPASPFRTDDWPKGSK